MPTDNSSQFTNLSDAGTEFKSNPLPFNPNEEKVLKLTFGQKLVGLTFNQSGDEKVNRAKQICAELADLANDHWENKEHTRLENQLYDHTIGEILNAQMNVVKLLTLKY